MYGYSYRWMKTEVYLEVPDKQYLAKADPLPVNCWENIGTLTPNHGHYNDGPNVMAYCRR
jgi:hypothetical protein